MLIRSILVLILLVSRVTLDAETLSPSEIRSGVVEYSNDTETFDNETNQVDRSKNTKWVRADLAQDYLDLNPIRFTNKSSCGSDANKPTASINLIVDTLFAGKLAYRYAQATNQDKKYITKTAISRFRYTVLSLTELIATNLLNGELPLLPHSTDNIKNPSEYIKISSNCPKNGYCKELDRYIKKIWNNRFHSEDKTKWSDIDSFSKKSFFSNKLAKDNKQFKLSCYYLKKHSPLQKHIDLTHPKINDMATIANAVAEQSDLLASCFDFDQQNDLEYAGYQIDLSNLNDREWNKLGFDFWYSLKLYFSFAYRYKNTISQFAFPYGNLFKNIQLEDSVMFFSNNCKSITKPICNDNYITEQIISDFASVDYAKNFTTKDHNQYYVDGAEQEMIKLDSPDFNSDILDMNDFDSMDKWIANLKKNFQNSRGQLKTKILDATNNLDLFTTFLTPEKIVNDILKLINNEKEWDTKLNSDITENYKLNQLYYLCAEYLVGADETLSFIRADINKLSKLNSVDPIIKNLTDKKVSDFFNYFTTLNTLIAPVCQTLEQKKVWSKQFAINSSGFMPWYKETIYKNNLPDEDIVPFKDEVSSRPLLAYNSFNDTHSPSDILCLDGIECARKTLTAMIDLYSTSRYLNTFFTNTQKMKSSNMLNPLSERVACGVYDPWWKLKKTYLELFTDLGQAAVNAVYPVPIYISATIPQNKVISFNQLIDDGEISFDPNFDGPKVLASMGVDFGPLLGIPCTVSISNDKTGNFNGQYYFSGITVQQCVTAENSEIVISSTEEDDKTDIAASGCISCNMNFDSAIASGLGPWSSLPYVNTTFHLLRGVLKFVRNYRDPINIPKDYTVDVNKVFEAFRKYGEIPKSCYRKLLKNRDCVSSTESELLNELQIKNLNLAEYYYKKDQLFVKTAECNQTLEFNNAKTFFNWFKKRELDINQVKIPQNCSKIARTLSNEFNI